jgi:hypothetical protein
MTRNFYLVALVLASLMGPLSATPARADTLQQTQSFRVNSFYDSAGASSLQATLRAIGTKGYFYVDDRYWSFLTPDQQAQFMQALEVLSQQFDNVIYPLSVQTWGSEATPGVDNDARVVILLQRLIAGSGGYFETIHNYPKDRAPDGNAREMIFVSAESVLSGTARTFIAHEFQHLISFYQRELTLRAPDDVWLNESRSEYNVTVVGYSLSFEGSTLQRRQQSFLRNSSDSLTDWPNTASDYAVASLFAHYLVDRFGVGILASTTRMTLAGASAIDSWLATHTSQRFSDVFVDWMLATSLNDRSLESAYGYTSTGLTSFRVLPTVKGQLNSANEQVVFAGSLKEWQPMWAQADVSLSGVSVASAQVSILGASDVAWSGAIVASYRSGATHIIRVAANNGSAIASVPLRMLGSELYSLSAMITHGRTDSVANRTVLDRSVTISLALGERQIPLTSTSTTLPVSSDTRFAPVADGDLIRRVGQEEIYVVWGGYRRFLTRKILELYGFENRPVREVSDDVFFRYNASIYIRAQNAKQVFAVWPDGTKHWFNITAAQWDASGRDWGAIFTVNDAEVAAYELGAPITR